MMSNSNYDHETDELSEIIIVDYVSSDEQTSSERDNGPRATSSVEDPPHTPTRRSSDVEDRHGIHCPDLVLPYSSPAIPNIVDRGDEHQHLHLNGASRNRANYGSVADRHQSPVRPTAVVAVALNDSSDGELEEQTVTLSMSAVATMGRGEMTAPPLSSGGSINSDPPSTSTTSPSCYICLDAEDTETGSVLYHSPCQCRGSAGYVHGGCLQKQVSMMQLEKCSMCHTPLPLQRDEDGNCANCLCQALSRDVRLVVSSAVFYIVILFVLAFLAERSVVILICIGVFVLGFSLVQVLITPLPQASARRSSSLRLDVMQPWQRSSP